MEIDFNFLENLKKVVGKMRKKLLDIKKW